MGSRITLVIRELGSERFTPRACVWWFDSTLAIHRVSQRKVCKQDMYSHNRQLSKAHTRSVHSGTTVMESNTDIVGSIRATV